MAMLNRVKRALTAERSDRRPSRLRSRPALESLESRVVLYSASGNLWAAPQLITLSFVPDGTNFNGKSSNLISTFNSKFGSAAAWQNVFLDAAQVWAQQTNINFKVVTDSGAATGTGSYEQGDSTFGDIRIGGYNFGTTTLAQAFMPPQVNNYSVAGDIAINTNQTFNIGSSYDLFTVASHEIGHALGLNHGAIGSIMASSYPGTMTALQTDDINGIRNIYSANAARAKDSYDTAAANDTFATASLVTSSINTTTKAGVINSLDLSTSTDVDWYKFVLPTGSATTLKVKAVATGLSLLDPKIEIYDSTNVLKATGNGAAYGSIASATWSTVAAGQTWYVKVYSADAKADFKTGKYSLILNMGTGADPAVTLPSTQTANGTPLTLGGGVAVTDGVETPVNSSSTSSNGLSAAIPLTEGGVATTISTGQPKIAIDSSGNNVVVWTSSGQDGSGWGIYAQRYNSSGVAQGSAFLVNTTTAGDQSAPAVAMSKYGDFVVTWASYNQDASNTWGIYAQRYTAAGVLQGSEFKVNTTTAGDQVTPAVGIDSNGNILIAWSSFGQDAASTWGIYAQRYNASGVVQGSEFRVNTTTAGDQINPVIAMNSNPSATAITIPNFEIAWSSYNQDASNSWGVYAQRYTSNGVVAGLEFPVNTTTAGDQKISGAAIDLRGNFIAVWTSAGQDGSLGGIYAARYDGLGVLLNSEFRVNTTTTGDQTNATVTSDRYGNFIVIWQSNGQDGSGWGIYGQQYTATAATVDTEFKANSTTAGDQANPATKMDSLGHLVVVWNGSIAGGTDGVFMQRYSVNTALESPPVGDAWELNGEGQDHLGAAPVGHSELSTDRVVDAGLHSGSPMDLFGPPSGPRALAGSHFGSKHTPNRAATNRRATSSVSVEALDAYFAHEYKPGDLTASFHSGVKGGRFGDTLSDGLFVLPAANGDNDLGDALALVHRKGSKR